MNNHRPINAHWEKPIVHITWVNLAAVRWHRCELCDEWTNSWGVTTCIVILVISYNDFARQKSHAYYVRPACPLHSKLGRPSSVQCIKPRLTTTHVYIMQDPAWPNSIEIFVWCYYVGVENWNHVIDLVIQSLRGWRFLVEPIVAGQPGLAVTWWCCRRCLTAECEADINATLCWIKILCGEIRRINSAMMSGNGICKICWPDSVNLRLIVI